MMVDYFKMLFLDVLDSHSPVKRKRVKYSTVPDWITEEIRFAMKERDLYAQRGDHPNWRKKRNLSQD